MRSRSLFIVTLFLVAVSAAYSQEALAAGGWEFGGSLKFTHRPDYPIFAKDVSEEDRGEFAQITDLSLSIGRFLSDGFSLALRPSMLLLSNHSMNSSLEKSINRGLFLGLGVEASWYVPLGNVWMVGLGGEAGIGLWPGLTEIYNDEKEPDKSLSTQFWLEPKLRGYILASKLVAPYAEAGYRLAVQRRVRTSEGDPYDSSESFLEEVRGRFGLTLGLKFFLPQGARYAETRKAPYNDFMDILISGH